MTDYELHKQLVEDLNEYTNTEYEFMSVGFMLQDLDTAGYAVVKTHDPSNTMKYQYWCSDTECGILNTETDTNVFQGELNEFEDYARRKAKDLNRQESKDIRQG